MWLIAALSKKNAHSQHTGQGSRWCRMQRRPQFPRDTSGGSPSSGGGSSYWGSDQSSQHSTVMRTSGESNWPAWLGRGLRVKVNLPIFRDEKTKDVVTTLMMVGHSCFLPLRWEWPASAAICLLVIAVVPRRPGKESRWGCYSEWHTPDTRWALWHGNGIWCPEQGTLFPQERIRRKHGQIWSVLVAAGPDTPVGVSGKDQWEHIEEMKWDHFYEGLNPEYQWLLVHKVDREHSTGYSDLLLAAQKLERQAEVRDPYSWRLPQGGIESNSFSDIRELVSLPEVEEQSYLHHPISYSGK